MARTAMVAATRVKPRKHKAPPPSIDALPDLEAEVIATDLPGAELLFDPDYIRERFARNFRTRGAAVAAYEKSGSPAEFDPSPAFVRRLYNLLHPDIFRKNEECLRHYLEHGRIEGRAPHPLFDPSYVLAQASLADLSVEPANVYFEFLAGNLPFSPHKLIHLEYATAQAGQDLTSVEIFRLLADPDKPIPFSPHPLFDVTYYSRFNDTECANQLIDYVIYRSTPKTPSPFFDDTYYSITQSLLSRTIPPLVHYLDHWHEWIGATCLLVDGQHINHNLITTGIPFAGDPVSAYLMNPALNISCHPHLLPDMISFAFANLQSSTADTVTIKDVMANFHEILTAIDGQSEPDISIVILNYYKPVLTFLSVCAALNAMRGRAVEILVVENAGEPFHFEALSRAFAKAPAVRLVKLEKNRFFGEGNNIGADLSRGKYIMFVNNDCFLREDFGAVLYQHLAERPRDCVGACLFFPEGTIQEFGGIVSDGGGALQRAKGLSADFLDNHGTTEEVDYCSAACVVLPREMWHQFAGFDPAFEPFFYEDTDLMRRIRATGGKVLVNPALRAVHIENASTGEFLAGRFHDVVQSHRSLFARRWWKYAGASVLGLDGSEPIETLRGALPPISQRSKPVAVLYTPFDIAPGGGERYLLTAGSALSGSFDVAICSQVEISTARVRFALNALGVAPFPFRVITWDELIASDKPDLLLAMGNEVVPPVPAIARHNWFHLQFPFPWRNVASPAFSRIGGYERVIVNSDFTADWSVRRFKEMGISDYPPIEVIHPPVRTRAAVSAVSKPRDARRDFVSVVNVGRFFVGGHSKRQDIFLDIIEEANLLAARPEANLRAARPIRGTLMGNVFDDGESQPSWRMLRRGRASPGLCASFSARTSMN